ncbi:hypothetical protein BB560_006013, partial [Smittium megazygosporum]
SLKIPLLDPSTSGMNTNSDDKSIGFPYSFNTRLNSFLYGFQICINWHADLIVATMKFGVSIKYMTICTKQRYFDESVFKNNDWGISKIVKNSSSVF